MEKHAQPSKPAIFVRQAEPQPQEKKIMASTEGTKKPGRQKGQTFISASDIFLAALKGPEKLRELTEGSSASMSALQTAKEMLTEAKQKVPEQLDRLIEAKFKSGGSSKAEAHKVGEVIEKLITVNRGGKPTLFAVPLDMYSVKDGDHAVIKFYKDRIVVMFKDLMTSKDKSEMMPER